MDGSSSSPPPQKTFKDIIKKPLVNNRIRAYEVRVIDETGKQLGIMNIQEALQIVRERGLDLIQVTEKVNPPVCKITDYGKFLYSLQKKERKSKKKISQLKGIRISFGISEHDLEIRAKQAEKFLKKGDKVKVQLILRGRQKALGEFAKEKIDKFIEILKESVPIKIERELKRRPGGLTMIISKE